MAANPRMNNQQAHPAAVAQSSDAPLVGVAPLAVGTLATDSRAIMLSTASTGLQVTFIDGSSATLTGLLVGTVYPFCIRSIANLGGGAGVALL